MKDEALKASVASAYCAWLLPSIDRLKSESEARAWRMEGQNPPNCRDPFIHHPSIRSYGKPESTPSHQIALTASSRLPTLSIRISPLPFCTSPLPLPQPLPQYSHPTTPVLLHRVTNFNSVHPQIRSYIPSSPSVT